MSSALGEPIDDLVALWRGNGASAPDAERVAREIMARVWRFDQQILWRNFREYAAGLVLMVIFAMQMVLGSDRTGGAIGFACVSFVMAVPVVEASRPGTVGPCGRPGRLPACVDRSGSTTRSTAAHHALLVLAASVRAGTVVGHLAVASLRMDGADSTRRGRRGVRIHRLAQREGRRGRPAAGSRSHRGDGDGGMIQPPIVFRSAVRPLPGKSAPLRRA